MSYQFWIDRGGTFTDIVMQCPDGSLVTHKLLSENPEQYRDAATAGIRQLLEVSLNDPIPVEKIESVKMGTTVATNALLERKGEPVVLFTTKGFRDALRIGYQNRPRIFDRNIRLPELLYKKVVEVNERIDAHGSIVIPIDGAKLKEDLKAAYDEGFRSIAIVLMHGRQYTNHEQQIVVLARETGFTQISASHEVIQLMKFVSCGDTTVVDAYLSPILKRYVDQIADELPGVNLMFMQSNGGLTDAYKFRGKDSILSGPAGGIIGMVGTAHAAGFDKLIGFDMGGTSTDVSHYAGELEREFDTMVAGVRMRAPMLAIHTIAAGGGSILHFENGRYRVGPDSAGANPGPACYRRGGPLTITDCNVMLGKIRPETFPKVFGPSADQEIDVEIVREKFSELAKILNRDQTPEDVAEGFIHVAVTNMANAIKHISVERGRDVTEYALVCFGGAGAQHACLVADELGIKTIYIHPLAGVLSAYGMGLANITSMREQAIETLLNDDGLTRIKNSFNELTSIAILDVVAQGVSEDIIAIQSRVHLRYEGTDTALIVPFGSIEVMTGSFETLYKERFSFLMPKKSLIIEAVSIEAAGSIAFRLKDKESFTTEGGTTNIKNTTIIVEPGWDSMEVGTQGEVILKRITPREQKNAIGTSVDPVMLEVFNNLFMSIAEQMGLRLAATAHSVNIKERLDFSCAIFDGEGNLIANAPHIPVHLGSMGESIKTVMRENAGRMRLGDVYVLNDPYHGGTHLPDVTVITPVFNLEATDILFYVGSRGHHADIGGITPGSMPPFSKNIEEEGILLNNIKLVEGGAILDVDMRRILSATKYPARNIDQNLADLRAQIAANEKGVRELHSMMNQFGLDTVKAYMQHVQDNAEESVRRAIEVLHDGEFEYEMDNSAVIQVKIIIDKDSREATIDFTGTSKQLTNNFNAPSAVVHAAVLYVFRTLVDSDIPLNAGCLKPLRIIIPEESMLNPRPPAAVVAGNVETSQYITDALYGALGILASSYGTMNNFTFGNERYQYYETISGGTGAGQDFDGCDTVQAHMTNSRLTDPEVLEWRFPIMIEEHSIRKNSGGKGTHNGGNGAIRRVKFLEPMTAAILSGHRRIPPFGLKGGEPGALGRTYVERATGEIIELAYADQIEMNKGDVFVIETPGGGGFGSFKLAVSSWQFQVSRILLV